MNWRRWWLILILCLFLSGFALPAIAMVFDPPHDPPSGIECLDCHSIHGASYPTLLGELCESCHFDGGPAPAVTTHSSRTTDAGYGNWDLDCWACHNPHEQEQDNTFGTSYGKLIRHDLSTLKRTGAEIKEIDPDDPGPYYWPLSIIRTVTSSNIEFKSQTEFVDGDGSADDDICQVCHESTSYYNPVSAMNTHADYGADSQPGGNCTTCHPHTQGFSAAGGGSCVSCHAQAQPPSTEERRQVTGTGGDFERTSHHVTDGTTTEIVTDGDCTVCHDQGNHQSSPDPNVLLNDPDGQLPSYTYTGTGAAVADFCLRCHDAEGPLAYDVDGDPGDGRQPFSDNRTPQDIATTWTASSHGTSTVSVLADDKCLACHGGSDSTRTETVTDHNAHGSAVTSLLSLLVAGETVANPEEALCFACHDADGPSVTDIEARFSPAIRWVTAAAGENSNADLNDRHDIQDASQSRSGAKVECTDCHDPHADYTDIGIFPLKDDPDPTDLRTPGTGQILPGADFMTEWCLDCHDGSLPNTVTPPSTPLKDIRYAFQNEDSHGTPTGSPVLKSGYGWAAGDLIPCLACHTRHHVSSKTNLFQLVDLVKSKDGSTDIPSDSVGLNYELTDNNVKNAAINGYEWCNTCHTGSMGNKKPACFGCHYHGARF